MNVDKLLANSEIVLKGHVLNWLWRPRLERRKVRGEATAAAWFRYLKRYVPKELPRIESSSDPHEYAFSIWLQGVESAPPVVRACLRSAEMHSRLPLRVLDEKGVLSLVNLPDYILEKYRAGNISPAHFTDICRVALLCKFGGVWLDATDFLQRTLPQSLIDEDVFIYLGGDKVLGSYAFVQNCFIRARRGNPMMLAWLGAMYAYWKEEDRTVDYFVHQMLFRVVVEGNAAAKDEFARMRKCVQDPTHLLWYQYGDQPFDEKVYDELASMALFQKTDYKSPRSRNPIPGSFAEHLLDFPRDRR